MNKQIAVEFREKEFYPEAFFYFDRRSVKAQTKFFCLTYVGLFLSLLSSFFCSTTLGIKFPALKFWAEGSLLTGAGLILCANLFSFEADWYRYRAAAESIKTLTWLYRLNVEGFTCKNNIQAKISSLTSDFNVSETKNIKLFADFKYYVIPNEFNAIKSLYDENRLKEQWNWYFGKASYNCVGNFLTTACLWLAVFLTLASFGSEKINSSLIATLLACIVALAQTKRFKELQTAYTTTLFDLENVKNLFENCNSSYELTKVILQCELAFSREHVRWLARVENSICSCCPHKISAEKSAEKSKFK